MPSQVLRVLPRQIFDFNHLTAADATETRTLATVEATMFVTGVARLCTPIVYAAVPGGVIELANEDPSNVLYACTWATRIRPTCSMRVHGDRAQLRRSTRAELVADGLIGPLFELRQPPQAS